MAVSELKRPLHGGFESEKAKNLTAIYLTAIYLTDIPQRTQFSVRCNGHVTAVAAGQWQRLVSGVGMFTGNYLSSL
jgi:hypothetical protein